MKAKEIYKSYPVEVQQYMQAVIDCLIEDYGKIPASWRISLDLIADSYDLYLKAKEDIEVRGISYPARTGEYVKNCSLTTLNAASATIRDLLKSFSLTPMSRAKIKHYKADPNDYGEDDYLEDLVKD